MNATLIGDADGDGGVWCPCFGRAYVQSVLAWCIRVLVSVSLLLYIRHTFSSVAFPIQVCCALLWSHSWII